MGVAAERETGSGTVVGDGEPTLNISLPKTPANPPLHNANRQPEPEDPAIPPAGNLNSTTGPLSGKPSLQWRGCQRLYLHDHRTAPMITRKRITRTTRPDLLFAASRRSQSINTSVQPFPELAKPSSPSVQRGREEWHGNRAVLRCQVASQRQW